MLMFFLNVVVEWQWLLFEVLLDVGCISIVVHCEVYLDEDELMEGRQQLFI